MAGPDGQKLEDGPPQDPQALANFLSGMLTLIGRDVDGQPYVDAIEVWNEPNLRREWRDHAMTGAEYMRYFRPAYSAIRAFSPHITIITAAPAHRRLALSTKPDVAAAAQRRAGGLRRM